MSWTDERTEQLKSLWIEGPSASQIARVLGGITRNAVISKAHRLGLAGRASPSRPARPRLPRASRRQLKLDFIPGTSLIKTEEDALAFVASLDSGKVGVPLADLERGYCHAAKGTDDEGVGLYCGAPTPSRRHEYCNECTLRVHQRVTKSAQSTQLSA